MLRELLAVAAGGALGAISRYGVIVFYELFCDMRFPYATLTVNAIGSFIAGILLILLSGRYGGEATIRLFLFTGFLGALTTFSSFAAESLSLFEHGQYLKLMVNILLNNALSLLMVFGGARLAEMMRT